MKIYPQVQSTTTVFYPSWYHEAVMSGELALYFKWSVDFTLFYSRPLFKVDRYTDVKIMNSRSVKTLLDYIEKFQIHGLSSYHFEDSHVLWPCVYPTRINISRKTRFEGKGPEGLSLEYLHYVKFTPHPKVWSGFSFDCQGALHSDFMADLNELARRAAYQCASNPFLTNRIYGALGKRFRNNECLGMLIEVAAEFSEHPVGDNVNCPEGDPDAGKYTPCQAEVEPHICQHSGYLVPGSTG